MADFIRQIDEIDPLSFRLSLTTTKTEGESFCARHSTVTLFARLRDLGARLLYSGFTPAFFAIALHRATSVRMKLRSSSRVEPFRSTPKVFRR